MTQVCNYPRLTHRLGQVHLASSYHGYTLLRYELMPSLNFGQVTDRQKAMHKSHKHRYAHKQYIKPVYLVQKNAIKWGTDLCTSYV